MIGFWQAVLSAFTGGMLTFAVLYVRYRREIRALAKKKECKVCKEYWKMVAEEVNKLPPIPVPHPYRNSRNGRFSTGYPCLHWKE